MTEANRALSSDLADLQSRFDFLESKYKDLLIKYEVASKQLKEKQETVFQMATGANRSNYE
jgi:hypothetical protein